MLNEHQPNKVRLAKLHTWRLPRLGHGSTCTALTRPKLHANSLRWSDLGIWHRTVSHVGAFFVAWTHDCRLWVENSSQVANFPRWVRILRSVLPLLLKSKCVLVQYEQIGWQFKMMFWLSDVVWIICSTFPLHLAVQLQLELGSAFARKYARRIMLHNSLRVSYTTKEEMGIAV